MNSAIQKLANYLTLEAERGFDNGAVVGGLDRMLDPWEEEARESGVPPELADVVVARLRDYPRLSAKSREETLRGLWNRLHAEYPELASSAGKSEGAGTKPVRQGRSQAESSPESPQEQASLVGTDAVQTEGSAAGKGSERIEPGAAGIAAEAPASSTATAPKSSSAPPPVEPAALDSPLIAVPGIGPKSAKTLKKLGLETLEDLLWHLPRRYDDYSQLKTINRLELGEEITIIGTVEEISVRPVRGGRLKLVEATVSDGTGSIGVTWFNQTWIANRLKVGKAVVLSGGVEQYLGKLTMNGPEWEPLERKQVHTNRIVPVYPLTAGVTAKWLRRVINSVVQSHAQRVPDPLPPALVTEAGLMPFGTAFHQVHFPDSWDQLKHAQHRLAFNEMLLLQLGVLRQKRGWQEPETEPIRVADEWVDRFLAGLPYQLTDAQGKALAEVRADLERPVAMNRLIEGDVGSGKTVIAAAAIGMAASAGMQSAVMAPTSILAEQHHATFLEFLPELSIRLLLGSTPEAEKEEIREGLARGEIQLVVGTHALLEDPVGFKKLGLAVIDEQHRFGVAQRAALRSKGINPNLIVMTATPIPRSLALTIYGDLDLTIVDEMPPGRLPVETRVFRPVERARAHTFIRGQLEAGHQAFIIYPLVEGSDKVQAKAAVDEHKRLQQTAFPEYRLGLLHGRLKPEEKERVMNAFRQGEYDLLVSTSVVEVGMNVPNATVILVEGADRFGLSQLHQFRGRVTRSNHQSYCLLIPTSDRERENERLLAMEETSDGFELADRDLKQRGPGDFFGTRQSGFLELRAARLTDLQMIEKARSQAARLFEEDPMLEAPQHRALAAAVDRFWTNGKGEMS
ncbi:MAG: ATP-dependent DNA helicase RecG [Anaerolineae bacterium]|nr:MAG: ATP-dependent DNA helicase RecG [Anaerolineae bacterium]